ncbi:DUF2200 domain-containing protein [Aurantiacibacter sp. D1-12]|uniref:DUF2200 domain-containing protein n=1 Tax=Aurantiacibacter sp. D1-12 TaxID=2993658 RepID=UPI00237CD3B8|nr:DUF2200 domain-containing protein [Aurantiacibacter sp. D1-12]MDE1466834.1 DUF2200 domain-containing protein [Aurantiacibacter sp. D1-12]
MAEHKVFSMSFASIYPHYVNKVEKKGRTKDDLDKVLRWVTGYSQEQLDSQIDKKIDCRTFIEEAPLNPDRTLIKGVVCGVRVEEVEDPLMRELRYMDKVVDELARGKKMESILRKPE